ncbi:ABC transporter substrate-binding protein [Shewanella sp. D64]|uniref:ABC transporter substrate-binding protein n=1 Tax=unclassified Shewanella TaxID=196818 RepID=UPI0022BA11BA|nr:MULTISPECIES: ABC transporter substrate-binding protein [unclassified Shewanella]MEC4728919.1 ABC transporter substrate-binding protein [Shewanella sp. D64]MEC4740793.1 ABC transporter substrate-binding protein [Shewanella sp. E94]WBJ96007.1 ABC transporter substrate-binding protein [Shewanella sp. MTB7]
MLRITVSLLLSLMLTACSHEPLTNKITITITIAINPWSGYELLYLAEKRFFKDVGLNIELAHSDAQRAYISGRVDGFASTIVEAVQAQEFGGAPLKVVLLADYSNGGDVILSQAPYQSLSDLKGKKIGCEVSSLGIYILARALTVHGMSLNDVEVVNVEQGNALQSLDSGLIDAMVSYPPYSFEILNDPQQANHKIFTTAEIPNEILDTVSFSTKVIKENPNLVSKLGSYPTIF